jgi:hypothetical protein
MNGIWEEAGNGGVFPASMNLAGRSRSVDEQIDQQRRGQEIEHDGRDDDMAAPASLQIARNKGPGRAESAGNGQRHQNKASNT